MLDEIQHCPELCSYIQTNLYFWRDNHGNEVDVIIDRGDQLIPIQVKSGLTINADYFKGLKYWQALNKNQLEAWLVYAGDESQQRSVAHVLANYFDVLGV